MVGAARDLTAHAAVFESTPSLNTIRQLPVRVAIVQQRLVSGRVVIFS